MHTDPYLGIGGFLLGVLVVILGDFKNHKDTLIPKAPLFGLEKSNFIEALV
jgi:hypothetical protein